MVAIVACLACRSPHRPMLMFLLPGESVAGKACVRAWHPGNSSTSITGGSAARSQQNKYFQLPKSENFLARILTMAKLTFRRVVTVLHRYYAVACLPVVGGVLFLFGSLFFLPEAASHRAHVIGATCFIAGSFCYLIAPLMDFMELQINLTNLVDQVPSPSSGGDSRFEVLYKSQLLQA